MPDDLDKEIDASDIARVKDAVNVLMKYFDSVQIFVIRHEGDSPNARGTSMTQAGRGNWYARYGAIKLWLAREEEIDINQSNDEDDA